ncbi:protein kinase domain-containing protein [Sorangium sp. So ce131]|uniref:serine/threonine-protein kinase n=1 Tax=Sorangium sp. So ce131 TaxID=3133282 RepID=UPI003F6432B0
MHLGSSLADRFVIERLAGRGGMGEVYRGLDRSTGQPVAIKVLRGGWDAAAARFAREVMVLARIDHPLVVRHVAEGVLPSGEPYLVMEWLEGEDLAARLARGRISTEDGVALALSVAEALGALHAGGVVHRDLKPSNIFLVGGRLDRIKILDFGLVRVEALTPITASGTLLGTVAYMAPEQARGARHMDARADVFALGCVLFECLTGDPPFAAASAEAILTKILFEETPRLRDRMPAAPPELDALLARMLSKQPDDRPRDGRSAAAMLRALGVARAPDVGLVGLRDTEEMPGALALARTTEMACAPGPPALTDIEQRAVAVILIGPPVQARGAEQVDEAALAGEAAAHGGALEWLLDGTAAVLLSTAQVATDLAAQAARCALRLGQRAPGRQITLAIGMGQGAARAPVGPAIDRAARLLGEARSIAEGRPRALIALDGATVGLLDARFDVRDDGGALTLLGERDVADARTLLGGRTPFVGRERELRMVEALFHDCVEGGEAHAVLVTAPPGVGKSRLGRACLESVRARGEPTSVWVARGEPLRTGSSFGMLAGLIQSACGVRGGEPLPTRQERLSARVAERIGAGDRARVTEFLGELIDAPFPDERSAPLRTARRDAQVMSEQVRAAFLDLIAAECAARPLLILLDDLHWCDGATARILDVALRELRDRPLFVLALARPEVHDLFPELWASRRLQEIRLRELPRKAAERLATHVLGGRAGAATIERLVRLSAGNAFYLEELIRATAEGRGEDLPETVVAMVQSRLGALADEDRRALRAASVFGETFWSGAVAALCGGAPGVTGRIEALVEQELLTRREDSRFPDEHEYTFRHALVREGAYAMLTDADRSLGHRLAGAWLEAHGEQDAPLLAEHFEKGGDEERAARHYQRAALTAHYAAESAAAVAYARRGLAFRVPDDLRIQLLGALCQSLLWQLARVPAAVPQARELMQIAPRGSVPWVHGLSVVVCGALMEARREEFMHMLHLLQGTEPSPDAADAFVLAINIGVHALDTLGMIKEADALLERLTALRDALGDGEPAVVCNWHGIRGLRWACAREEPATALLHAEEAMVIARALGHGKYCTLLSAIASMNRWLIGAAEAAERTLVGMRDDDVGMASSFRPFILAWLLADRGALADARGWAEGLVASGQAKRLPQDEGRGRWALAEVLRRAGELDAAGAEAQAALELLRAACPIEVPGVLATLAAVRLAEGRAAEGAALCEEGLARTRAMGGCSLFFRAAFLRLVHAECLEAAGEREAARAAVAEARRRVVANADKIASAEHRASFLENVPENRRTLALAAQWLDA